MEEAKKVLISIKGAPGITHGPDDYFELTTDGRYLSKDGISEFSYLEYSHNIDDSLLTTFAVEKDKVVLRRDDGISGELIFSKDQKYHCLYDTPFGSVMLGIDTLEVSNNMNDDGGHLEILYNIEIDNVHVGQNLYQIDIRSLPQ